MPDTRGDQGRVHARQYPYGMNNPPITAIRVDGHQLGSIAAKVLIGMLEGKKMPIKSCANYEIRLRQSTKRKKEKLI